MNPTDFVYKVVQNRRVILELGEQKELNMVNLEELLEEDAEGIIMISKLFDYAVREIYGDIETDQFVVCELNDKLGILEFSSNTCGKTLKLTIEENGNVSFWCDNIPCHFNQFEIYKNIFKIKRVA